MSKSTPYNYRCPNSECRADKQCLGYFFRLFWRREYPPLLGPNGSHCLSGDGLQTRPAPPQSQPVQSLPQLRSILLDVLDALPAWCASVALKRLSLIRNEARSAA